MNRARTIGQEGEDWACRYLQSLGWKIVARNYRYGKIGEIDIVARDGEQWVFVEVKTRRSRKFGIPEAAVTAKKQQQLRQLAAAFLAEHQLVDVPCRFDVIALEWQNNKVQLRHWKNAF